MYLKEYQDHNWDMMDVDITQNKWGFPTVRKEEFIEVKRLIAFNNTKEIQGICHFFLYDYMFRSVWNSPNRYINKLSKFEGILAPDFSTYTDYPLALNIFNVYRNRWLACFMQQQGIKVIPTLVWGERNSFDFAFDGIEEGCQVAVTTLGNRKDPHLRQLFLDGIDEIKKRIKPSQIILYGLLPKELEGDELIKLFDPYYNGYFVENPEINDIEEDDDYWNEVE